MYVDVLSLGLSNTGWQPEGPLALCYRRPLGFPTLFMQTESCCDRVTITTDSGTFEHQGSRSPGAFFSSYPGSDIRIRFTTDTSVTRPGFVFSYQEVETSSSGSSKKVPLIIGLVVGLFCGVSLLAACVAISFRRSRRARAERLRRAAAARASVTTSAGTSPPLSVGTGKSELVLCATDSQSPPALASCPGGLLPCPSALTWPAALPSRPSCRALTSRSALTYCPCVLMMAPCKQCMAQRGRQPPMAHHRQLRPLHRHGYHSCVRGGRGGSRLRHLFRFASACVVPFVRADR